MRILTVRQPWAWAIIHGGKDVENRGTNIAGDYRGPVAIHAGKGFDRLGRADIHTPGVAAAIAAIAAAGFPNLQFGTIIGVVDLVGVHEAHPDCPLESVWAAPTGWHLELRNPRPLHNPIPFKGALGLRKLDPETAARIEAQR